MAYCPASPPPLTRTFQLWGYSSLWTMASGLQRDCPSRMPLDSPVGKEPLWSLGPWGDPDREHLPAHMCKCVGSARAIPETPDPLVLPEALTAGREGSPGPQGRFPKPVASRQAGDAFELPGKDPLGEC